MIIINISIKEFLENNYLDLNYQKYNIIFDVSKDIFIKNIIILFNNLLYVLYYYNKDINIINDYKIIDSFFSIDPILLHTNTDSIDMFLALESWYSLLDKKECLNQDHLYELDPLNESQLLAVNSVKGVVNVMAPAGSGKTKTLINRIVNLLNNGVDKSNILVLAYNKKAEVEMKERLLNHFNIDFISVKTFHSFGNDIIKKNTTLNFIEDDSITKSIINNILNSKKRLINKYSDMELESYINLIKSIKESLLKENEINNKYKDFFNIYKEYLIELEKSNYYTYEDMLYITLIIILRNANLRYYLQSRYKYILVDEFQDLNKVQLYLLKILSLPNNNLFVVGDDDQMIYSFRGASILLNRTFINSYSMHKDITLSINYRSYENIVRHANMLIKNNIERSNKNIKSFISSTGNIDIFIGNNNSRVNMIKTWINALKNNNCDSFDNIILCRFNSDVLYLKCYLRLYNFDTGYSYKEIKKIRSIIYNNKGKKLRDVIIKYAIKVDIVLLDILSNMSIKDRDYLLKTCSVNTTSLNITTVHKTKGNEYKNVCYYYKSFNINEEERRIFYVAVTRAKNNILLLSDKPDLFIKEYSLNNEFSNISNKKLLRKIDFVKEKVFLDNCHYSLLEKDNKRLSNYLTYQISEEKEIYFKKENDELNYKKSELINNKNNLLLLNEEYKYRQALKFR